MEKTPAEICKEIKGHIEGVRDLLRGLYGDPAAKSSPYAREWPSSVHARAREALVDFNRGWSLEAELGFDELHVVLGLGPANWSGPCGHEKKETDREEQDS